MVAGDRSEDTARRLWASICRSSAPSWPWDRSEDTARRLWAAPPAGYRDRVVVCTDFWSAYRAVVPEERHTAGGKESGLTCGVERFGCTARPRFSRLVRKTRSFSKCDRNHVGALWYFIRHYNVSRR